MKIGKYITKCKCFVFRLENLVKSVKNSNRNLVDLFSHISASIYNRHSHRFIVNIIQNIKNNFLNKKFKKCFFKSVFVDILY